MEITDGRLITRRNESGTRLLDTKNGVSQSNKRRKWTRFKNREHINNYIMAQNTWKEKLQEVRSFVKETEKVESVVEETPVVSEGTDVENEIEELLKEEFAEESKTEETLESLQEERLRLQEELTEVDNRIKELDNGSVEKSVEKLAERNMLGRLSKTLRLNESGKQKLFDYFEKGEL